MTELWSLPQKAVFGQEEYPFNGDFRNILQIISHWNDESIPALFRWRIALKRFYMRPVPREHWEKAMDYLAHFVCPDASGGNGPKLLDWDLDAELIVADVNRVAGCEIRALPFVHWWTFLSWFHGVGEGQLATVVAIRDKLRRGKKLEPWEQTYYRDNHDRIAMRPTLSPEERLQKQQLEMLLERSVHGNI